MDYKKTVDKELIVRLKSVLKELPKFCGEFFLGISQTTSIKTRLGYAYDLRLFFNFLTENVDEFLEIVSNDFSLSDLSEVTYLHINLFLDYVSYHERESITKLGKKSLNSYVNSENGKARKLSAIKKMFTYLYKVSKIKSNPAELVDTPKIHKKNIVHLDKDEVKDLLDIIENGSHLTKSQLAFHSYTKSRDFAIVCLLLGTGIRVSECVGINLSDIDFKSNGIKIVRKGGNESIVYFGDEVEIALSKYLSEREDIIAVEGHEDALFLSLQKKRLGQRAIQNLVKKYSKIATPLKKISPHKLRSTYGTALYEKTEDIYLVADALGHADINTTKRYYAKMHEERRKQAAVVTRLRDE